MGLSVDNGSKYGLPDDYFSVPGLRSGDDPYTLRYSLELREAEAEAFWRFAIQPPMPLALPEEQQISLILERAVLIEGNRILAEECGFTGPAEMSGAGLSGVLPFGAEHLRAWLSDFIYSGYQIYDGEVQYHDSCGKAQWKLSNATGVVEKGHLVQIRGTHKNISKLRQVERDLHEYKEQLALAARSGDLALWDCSLQSGTISFSDSWTDLIGYSSQEIITHPETSYWVGLVHPEDMPALNQAYLAHIKGQAPLLQADFRARDKAGNWRWISANGQAVERDATGRAVRLVGVYRDVTASKQLEERLHQAQKMEAVGRLAGGIAHDFNNLLTVISGYAVLALGDLRQEDPLHNCLQEIKAASERAASLTNQLLAFSRKQLLQPAVLDLNRVVQETDRMLRRLIGEDIDLQSVLAAGLWPVKADPSQMEQILINLAVNARDAMPHGGRLIMETANAYLGCEYTNTNAGIEPGQYVVLAVSDTGCGMDTATQAHIFEPFFTTKEQGQGTGLGLATVYGIVKQSGGYIWVYSEVGRGTTFKVYLPRTQEACQKEAARLKAETLPAGQETILLAEDDAKVRGLAAQVLRRCGYQVVEAADGQEALRYCADQTITLDLLVTDVVMPGLDGRKLSDELTLSP